jgi:PAS domain S-box-containing protein
MVAKSTSPSNPEENGKVEGNMLSRESSLEFSWIESLAVPVFVIDLSQYVTGWNRRTAELTRISSQDILDRQLSSITHPDSLERLEIAVKEIEKGADSSVCDLTFPSCGVLRHFHIKLSAQKNASGKTSWIVCFAEEIKMPITGSPITPISECALPPASTERVFRRLDFPVFGLTFDGVITMWSSHIEKITGYPRDGVLGRLFVDYVPGDAHRKRVEGIFRAVKRDEACNSPQEIDVLLQNGKTKRVLLNVSAYRDTEDHTGGVFVVMTDASELYNYDGSLEVNHCESSGELATLIENSHAPIFGVNRNGEIDLWNKMSAELLGFSREFVLGKSLLESFIDPFFRQSVQAVLDVALDGNGTANYELEFQTKSGQSRYLLANISSRRNSSGQVKGVVVFAQDVTESAQNDRAVAARARELRQLVDTANAPIFGVDTAGRVNEWNDKTAEITGFSGDEAFNQPLVEAFIVPALQPSVQEVLYNALRGRSTSNFELEIRTKANETRYLLVNATTRRDAENNIVGVVGIAQDVTEACKHDRAVAAMANELRQLIDTANAPIFGIDRDG